MLLPKFFEPLSTDYVHLRLRYPPPLFSLIGRFCQGSYALQFYSSYAERKSRAPQTTNRSQAFFASSRLLAVISASSRNSNRRSCINPLPAQMVVVTIEFSNPNRMCQGRLSTVIGVVG